VDTSAEEERRLCREKDATGPGVCKELPVTRREVIRGRDELG
jgi:hypothetical protein